MSVLFGTFEVMRLTTLPTRLFPDFPDDHHPTFMKALRTSFKSSNILCLQLLLAFLGALRAPSKSLGIGVIPEVQGLKPQSMKNSDSFKLLFPRNLRYENIYIII